MSDHAIELRGVGKSHTRGKQTVSVLDALSLNVAAGEFLSLMGPSGSGKSTLLNLIGGLDTPTTGEVHVGGLRVDTLSAAKQAKWRARHVGFIFQFYNLLPVLNARRNVELPLLLTKLSAKERAKRVDLALDIVGLADRATHKPAELSGGQAQRVAIARAIVADPTVIIGDEPTGDLDRETADDILTLLQRLNQEQGKTIVMVTHDPKAAGYASRRVEMDKGSLADSGVAA